MSQVYRYQRLLIAPREPELAAALSAASQAANKSCRARKLDLGAGAARELLAQVAAEPAGFRQWNGTDGKKPRASSNDSCSAVAVAWWTDPLGRPHSRVVGDRVLGAYGQAKHLFCPYAQGRPPLWVVHPENLYFRDREDGPAWAVCRCGLAGSPEALGWMGLCCAACHDRAEEGTPPLPDGEPATTLLVGHTGWVSTVLFTPDGRTVVAGPRGGTRVLTWDLAIGIPRTVCPIDYQEPALAVAPDGETLAVGTHQGVALVALGDGREVQRLATTDPHYRALAVAFSPDGELLAVAPYGRVEIWDVAGGTLRATVAERLTAHTAGSYLAWSPDGHTLAIAHGHQGGILLWDRSTQTTRPVSVEGVRYDADGVAFSPDGGLLGVLAGTPGRVFVVEATTGRVVGRPEFDRAKGLAFSPDGRLLAVAGHDRSLRLYALPECRPAGVFYWHMMWANRVEFSPDGRWLATSADDGCVKLWPVAALAGA